jgi:pimeloyl-ACP methyl ester carboxylesterase
MNLDITIHKGNKEKPVVILIHGLSMNKDFWLDPLNTKMFAKNVPLRVFTARKPVPRKNIEGRRITLGNTFGEVRTLWSRLRDEGFSIVCWSQKRPVGPISAAVEELDRVMKLAGMQFPGNQRTLVGHSRGGLIARKYLEAGVQDIKAVITISTPHSGSSLAKIGDYLEPFSAILRKVSPKSEHTMISRTMKNIKNLVEGMAWKELMPDSAFFRDLNDTKQRGVRYVSLGGSQPRLFTLYAWKKEDNRMHAKPLLNVPDSLVKVFPPLSKVEEIVPGKGDGLVTAKSAVMPWTTEHHDLKANHVSIIWHKKTLEIVLKTLREM